MDDWVLKEVKKVLPDSDPKGRHFWHSFAQRIDNALSGLDAPEGGKPFVHECITAGCMAVPVVRRNALWERDAPPVSEKSDRFVYELRIRLGLFFAGCLRYLVQGVARMRVTAGDKEWYPVMDKGVSFREFRDSHKGKVEVGWTNSVPDIGETFHLATYFFPLPEQLMLTRPIVQEVLKYLSPNDPEGLFSMMLFDDGQLEKVSVDVAGVFLEGLAQAVDQKVLRVNTRADGHVFVTPEFWLLTAPIGLDYVKDFLRTRRQGRRYNFPRQEIFRALYSDGHLAGVEAGEKGYAVRIYEVEAASWDESLELYGLAITSESLPVQPNLVALFEGTVTFKREIKGGSDKG